MGPIWNAVLGLIFWGLSVAATFLMYHLWGYRFDHETHKSDAPPGLIRLHRGIGYLYGLIYVILMWQMAPRLWNYQIEFPARTVAHLLLGMTIGVILVLKVSIVRYFKHLESAMIPGLGTALLVCTTLLIGLSAPFAFSEAYLRAAHVGGSYDEAALERVKDHLALAGLDDANRARELASPEGLHAGRQVLLTGCIMCHDLRTVLIRPRTPVHWRQTVLRMADRSTLLAPITEEQQWEVTAYLIAISPELQRSARDQRMHEQEADEARAAASEAMAAPEERVAMEYDAERAKQIYETQCSLCHPLAVVEGAPPRGADEAKTLVARMVSNGFTATEGELELIIEYLKRTFGG